MRDGMIVAIVEDIGGLYVAEAPWLIGRPGVRGGGREAFLFVATSAHEMKDGLLRMGLVPQWMPSAAQDGLKACFRPCEEEGDGRR